MEKLSAFVRRIRRSPKRIALTNAESFSMSWPHQRANDAELPWFRCCYNNTLLKSIPWKAPPPPHIPLKAGDRRANWWKCDKVADTSLSVAEMLKAPGDEEAQQIRGLTKDIVHLGKIPIEREENTHYDDVIMSAIASQITSLTIVYSIVYSDQSKHQSSASLAFVWGIHRGPRWIPRTNGQLRGKCFHLMTSSCHRLPL